MFREDIKRIKVCIQYQDYYSALQYAILVKKNYKDKERIDLEHIITCIKKGEYDKIKTE